MALPVSRTNLLTNPVPASTTGFAVSGGTGAWTYVSNDGAPYARFTKDATVATTAFYWGSAITAAIGTTVSFRFWVRSSNAVTITLRNAGTQFSPNETRSLAANTWTEVVMEAHVTTIADFRMAFFISSMAAGTIDLRQGITEFAATSASYFSGASTDTNYKYAWTGTANASTSTRDYYGIWAEQVAALGAPRVQITVIGLGGSPLTTRVTRQAGREVWSVPGWKARNTLGGDTYTDWTAPLGVPITYTLFAAGQPINNMQITVTSTTGWVQDPLNPETAMPVALNGDNPQMLSLAKPALKSMTYTARFDEEYPLGGAYPIARAATRGAPQGVQIFLNAQTNAVSDALLNLVRDTPILLFRGLPSWGSIPSLAYTIGDVEEAPLNRDVGGGFTQWLTGGKLVAPVSLGPVAGIITNQMVADNLVGRTNASVAASSGNKRNIDIQANPLSLGQ